MPQGISENKGFWSMGLACSFHHGRSEDCLAFLVLGVRMCVQEARRDPCCIYSVHEPAMLSALLSGYKKVQKLCRCGVGRGGPGSGSRLREGEPDGRPLG